ncbi:MAG: cbb3-type cytochrome c oxidase subunit I [Armatimonadota bacterium]|nr:cbb3-type cytochrome c oxidase subunit I [Armatimonadota bacterium]MDR7402139.1 cbb3-type cytochrome c oxidase subunit I [Armatimonadota bacterium]MDR7404117.1 cbb3-type cytochrome c oxidase subunit I [Armatimonadota bacterium]MDR7437707.1 cbb3-type cytochrome c oxidase subunit I [Armatimonadota bacterium]MDR7472380.1 cbb3-type cytochrome c oxidase subunit I [Armatimonadota bacterium]
MIARGIGWGLVGFALGAGATLAAGWAVGRPPRAEVWVTVGYVIGLAGWLLGVGLWEAWARGWVGLPVRHEPDHTWRRYVRFTTDHKVIGVQYLVTFVALFVVAGAMALVMRVELAAPGPTVMGAAAYTHLMSLHGIIMIAVAVATLLGGFGNYLVPLMIGAEDMAFPRLNALSYWLVPPVAVLLVATPLAGGFDTGWTAYPPLSVVNASGQVLFNLAVITFGLSSILGGINFLATIVGLRAPGMSWRRLPIFVWSVFAASLISVTATQYLAAALLMVLLDREAGMAFFAPARGGMPLLYQHIFWFYSHPAVYIMILPAFGVALEVLTHFSRKPLYAYPWVVGGFLGIVGLSFVVWAHHLYTSGMRESLLGPFMATTELISIPTGLVFLAALGTLWMGRLWLRTPMLFALGFLFNFLIGGVTGIFNADVPTDLHLQDTYFVVGHFHYTIVGGMIFALFSGLYYWFPKVTGRMYDERLGRVHFGWMFLAYNATFLPMFWAGVHGMNRRIADYPASLAGVNLWISVMAGLLGASILVFLFNVVRSWLRGPRAAANPWGARTLEWQVPSPPPEGNFPHPPQVVGDPYGYGVPGAVHAVMAAAGGSGEGRAHGL